MLGSSNDEDEMKIEYEMCDEEYYLYYHAKVYVDRIQFSSHSKESTQLGSCSNDIVSV